MELAAPVLGNGNDQLRGCRRFIICAEPNFSSFSGLINQFIYNPLDCVSTVLADTMDRGNAVYRGGGKIRKIGKTVLPKRFDAEASLVPVDFINRNFPEDLENFL